MALANAGCTVEAVAPPNHPFGKTRAVRQTHTYRGLLPLQSFANAIAAAKPDLIVPGDDLAARHLHDLCNREQRSGKGRAQICALIKYSLGAPESFPIVFARTAFMDLAAQTGVRAPKTKVIKNVEDLREWVARTGFPTVLKADGTSGGEGVRIVRTLEEAERILRKLQAPPSLARAAKRVLVDHDMTLVWPSVLRTRYVVNAQAFVAGREATSLVACHNGAVLASLHFEVLNKRDPGGPATVVRRIENAEMSAAAETMVRRLELSGLHGFDFMIEANTGNAYLIEINPRTTQVGHLALGPGRDLPGALCAAVCGRAVQEAPKVTEKDTITLFPQEWKRNPQSPFLLSGYHDVPWDEPELVRACLREGQKQGAQLSRPMWIQDFSADHLTRL